MVIPLSDDNTGRTLTPVVNYALIALNVFVFVVPQGMGTNEKFTMAYSTVPQEIRTGQDQSGAHVLADPISGKRFEIDLEPTPVPVYLTLLTSMFMHGGWMHLLGNMLFLWIFGDNVEDALGHLRYVIFYLVCGILASLAHVASTFAFGGNPYLPSLGASGAISGVLGGYLLLYPHRQVLVLLVRIVTTVPAWVAIGMWFVFQLVSGLGALGSQLGGVAYAAHVGGFVAGLLLVKPFAMATNEPEFEQPPPGRWMRR